MQIRLSTEPALSHGQPEEEEEKRKEGFPKGHELLLGVLCWEQEGLSDAGGSICAETVH